jgi:threonine/homoserine efflux transporter RhtA
VICNETINAVRLGLRSAIQGVQEFDESLTDREVLALFVIVADVEGVPYAKRDQYDIKLYDEVRRRLQ